MINPKFCIQKKISIRNKGEIKTYADGGKLRQFGIGHTLNGSRTFSRQKGNNIRRKLGTPARKKRNKG